MRQILLLVLGIGLALAGYWLLADRDDSSSTDVPEISSASGEATGVARSPRSASASATEATAPAPIRMRSSEKPEADHVAPVATKDSIADAYESEERNEELAAKHDELVRNTVEHVAEMENGTGHIEELDCRARHCRLRISSGDKNGLVKLADALQDDRGFYGVAESIMLSRQEDDIVLYLRFSPPK